MTPLRSMLIAISLWWLASVAAAQPGTAFTYQGQLQHVGVPAEGVYDFQFALFSAAQGGDATAGPVENPGVTVSGGIFTTSIDFGAEAFAADELWLEIRVRDAGAGGGFTTLLPRQPITPVPVALRARNVIAGAVPYPSTVALSVGSGYSSMAVPADGLPVIAFRTAGGVTVAKCNDPYCIGGDETVSVVGSGRDPVLAITGDGLPVIAYTDGSPRSVWLAHCNDAACSGGDESINEVVAGVNPGKPALAIGVDGFPVIAFIAGENVWAVRSNDVACSGGDEPVNPQVTAAAAAAFNADQPGLGVPNNDLPLIHYRRNSDTDSQLIACNDPDCQGQDEFERTVEANVSVNLNGERQFAFTAAGNPILFGQGAGVLVCAEPACTSPFARSNAVLRDTVSAASGPDGIAAFAHTDGTALLYSRCLNTDCDGRFWPVPIVSSISGIQGTSLAYGQDGRPLISYVEGSFDVGFVLRVFHCNSPTCQ